MSQERDYTYYSTNKSKNKLSHLQINHAYKRSKSCKSTRGLFMPKSNFQAFREHALNICNHIPKHILHSSIS